MLEYRDGKLYRNGREAGWLDTTGYRRIYYERKQHYVHRVVWYLHHGMWPDMDIDHKDGNKLNNQIDNLRLATDSQNLRNQRKIKGYHKVGDRWRAQYSLDNKVYHIGLYDTELEARAAYDAAVAPLI